MTSDTFWRELRNQCEAIDSDSVLVTPTSDRPFRIVLTTEDRVVVQYADAREEHTLWRNQFDVLHDRIESTETGGLSLTNLPSGVEPYVSILSLSPQYTIDTSTQVIRRSDAAESKESPFLRPEWTARTPPERVHDDAILLADSLGRYDLDTPRLLSADQLVDLYVLLSDVQQGSDQLRQEIGEILLEYIGPDAKLPGQFGTIRRISRETRHLKDEETVLAAIDEKEIPREWVLGVDSSKLDVVLTVTDLEEDEVYEFDEQVYVQKTAVEEEEKQSRLQGLKDRIEGLEDEDADELRADIEDLENRIETLLAAG